MHSALHPYPPQDPTGPTPQALVIQVVSKSKGESVGVCVCVVVFVIVACPWEKTRSAEKREMEREKMRLLLKNAAQVLQVVDDRRSFLRGEREMKNLALIENGSIVVDAE